MSVFVSDAFLSAFSTVRGDLPVYGERMWIGKAKWIKYAFCSPWNGFIDDPDVELIEETARKHGAVFVKFKSDRLLHDSTAQELSPRPTLVTFPDYSPPKEVRWAVRKAESSGLKVRDGTVDVAYPVLRQLWETIPATIPKEFYDVLVDENVGSFLCVYDSGRIVSSLFQVIADGVYYMYSLATLERYLRKQASMLLVSHFLRQAFTEGARYVDLCGCSIPSIYRFKKQFSSEIRYRPRYLIELKSLTWSLLRRFGRARGMYRDLIGHLPHHLNWRENLV